MKTLWKYSLLHPAVDVMYIFLMSRFDFMFLCLNVPLYKYNILDVQRMVNLQIFWNEFTVFLVWITGIFSVLVFSIIIIIPKLTQSLKPHIINTLP